MDTTQRVNIQYSVEVGDLEGEVNRLYGKANKEMTSLVHKEEPPKIKLGSEALEEIDYIRRRLAKIDIMLGDVQNIVEGYVRYKTAPPQEQKKKEEVSPPDVDLLQEQLEKFKELMDANADQES